ncbi:hypothetical protein GIB67_000311, partial [Kingdonia uniflora]
KSIASLCPIFDEVLKIFHAHLYVSCCCDCKHLAVPSIFWTAVPSIFRKAVPSIFWTATCSSAEWTLRLIGICYP